MTCSGLKTHLNEHGMPRLISPASNASIRTLAPIIFAFLRRFYGGCRISSTRSGRVPRAGPGRSGSSGFGTGVRVAIA